MTLKRYSIVLDEEQIKILDRIAQADERSRSSFLRKKIQDILGEKKNEC